LPPVNTCSNEADLTAVLSEVPPDEIVSIPPVSIAASLVKPAE